MGKYELIKILIADDDEEDRFLIRNAFEQNKLKNEIVEVEDGIELLDYLQKKGKFEGQDKTQLPDIILLDLNMPRKNGLEVLKELKEIDNLKQIPVIILTTSQAEVDILSSYKLGVNSFITKPVTFESLLETVKTFEKYWIQIVKLPPRVDDAK